MANNFEEGQDSQRAVVPVMMIMTMMTTTTTTMKSAVFQNIMPHDPHCSMLQLLVTVNVVPISPILVTLMMKVIRSSETLVFTSATQCNIPEDGTLQWQ
jgi:hypothetical protein